MAAQERIVASGFRTPPPDFSAAALFRDVYWHQRWEIFPGVFVPGHNDVAFLCDAVQLPADLTGMRVLDVGAWHGCFSFECERRGASEVVALSLEDPEATGFERLKRILNSKVRYVTGSAYQLSPAELGTFDIVLFFGVLYHLRYPLLAVDRLRSICHGEVFIETHVFDERKWVKRNLGTMPMLLSAKRGLLSATPVWRQYREFELNPLDQSNWFGPNVMAVLETFKSAGFTIEHTRSWRDRAGFRAKVCDVPIRLQHTYEGCSANVGFVGLQAAQDSQPSRG